MKQLDRQGGAGAVRGWYVDVPTNSVVVTITEGAIDSSTVAMTNLATSFGDSVRIEHRPADQAPQPAEWLVGGYEFVPPSGGTCSVGFNTLDASNHNVVLTAGHCVTTGGWVSRYSYLIGFHPDRAVKAIERFAQEGDVPMLRFRKGESKEETPKRYLERARREGRTGVYLIGVAQEKAMSWRGWGQGGSDGHPHFEFGRQAVFVHHYYCYLDDRDFGPAFVKTCAYAPFPVWLYLNGHERAKRQADRQGLSFEELGNGFRSTADAGALAAICARLSARDVERFFRRWQARLPSPFTAADRRSGYRYRGLSDTRVFDRPLAGRQWFEQTLRDQLTLGRPDRVAVVFGRRVNRTTPGRFVTRVITGSSRRSRSTTRPRRSSSTSKRAGRCGPRRPSTTATTSASAGGWRRTIGTRSAPSAKR